MTPRRKKPATKAQKKSPGKETKRKFEFAPDHVMFYSDYEHRLDGSRGNDGPLSDCAEPSGSDGGNNGGDRLPEGDGHHDSRARTADRGIIGQAGHPRRQEMTLVTVDSTTEPMWCESVATVPSPVPEEQGDVTAPDIDFEQVDWVGDIVGSAVAYG